MPIIYIGTAGGVDPTAYPTLSNLLSTHAATPLADGTIWYVADVGASGESTYGTVVAGQLVPDPVRVWLNRSDRVMPIARYVTRPVTIYTESSGLISDEVLTWQSPS